ncbi:DNA repair protein RecO [Candidatus Poribacteria bacterium]
MPVLKTKAIVLGGHPLGEADRIVAFHTEDFGNIRAVARGVRKTKSRLCGRMEILTCGDLVFYERAGKDLHVVNSFDIVESFQALREDLMKMAYCSYLAELIQHVESSDDPDSDTFDLMLDIMFMMKTTDDPEMLVRVFEMRFLTNSGLSPQLDDCLDCSCDIGGATTLRFNVAEGGVLCNKCVGGAEQSSAILISRGTLELMKKMQQAPLELISRLKILENSRRELKKVLRNFISFHTDVGRLRSLDFLASIESDVMLKA